MRKLLIIGALAMTAAQAQNVLNNSDHAVNQLNAAVTILNGSVNPPYVDQTCMTGYSINSGGGEPVNANGCDSWSAQTSSYSTVFATAGTLVADSTNAGASLFAGATATSSNHAPYSVLNTSATGYSISGIDQTYYSTLASNNQISVWPFCGGPQSYPGIVTSTILSLYAGQQCSADVNIEFSMTSGYEGFETTTPSGTSAALAAVYGVLKKNHASWTMADIKAALRQTADGWANGYLSFQTTPTGYGYGNVNYAAANALSGTSAIYLQAPGMAITNYGPSALVTLYPFVTTRRAKEVIYLGGTWPAPSTLNEMTAAQITAAGGTKVYDDGGATGIQTFVYAPAVSGSVTFTVLTLDGSGNGSRVESFSRIAETFTVGLQCYQ